MSKVEQVPFTELMYNDMRITIVVTKITPESIVDAIRLSGEILSYTKKELQRGNPTNVRTNLVKAKPKKQNRKKQP